MEQDLETFRNYVYTNYDTNNALIREKYEHTIRVAMLMIDLGLRLNLSDEDLRLAFLIGLFHDLGRFREVVRSNKFNNLTFDHAAYSNKILFNDGLIHAFNISEEDYLLIKKAVFFHNKKDLSMPLTEREELFAKMIRDMDKLDIITVMVPKNILSFTEKHNPQVLTDFFNGDKIDLKYVKTPTDRVILYLSFIRDLYFDESKEMAMERRDLNKLINGVRVSLENQELFDHVVSSVYHPSEDFVLKKKK